MGRLSVTSGTTFRVVARRAFASSGPIRVSKEVTDALSRGDGVVALESTIVAHGMPWPRNLEAAQHVEAEIRALGAVPATVAVLNGVPTVGLSGAALEALARQGPAVAKCSTRELPLVMAKKAHGATTVAASARLARLAGIDVFVTGGVGGVHRGGEDTMDVSADLPELGRVPLVVVCAGVKSILDIGRTLEYLETEGVPVAAYNADDFPAFFSPKSGHKAPARLDSPIEVARHFLAARQLGLSAATLLCVPNPSPADEAVEAAVQEALAEAQSRGVAGAATTPFVLARVADSTEGDSLESNVKLVLNNARIGAQVAVQLAELRRR